MALPKKKKFLKFSLPKKHLVCVVYKRRHRGFKLGLNLTKNYFFSHLSVIMVLHFYLYVYPLLSILRAYYTTIILCYKVSLMSVFVFKGSSSLKTLEGMLSFTRRGAFLINSFCRISGNFAITLRTYGCDGIFALSKGLHALTFRINSVENAKNIKLSVSSSGWLGGFNPTRSNYIKSNLVPRKVSLGKRGGKGKLERASTTLKPKLTIDSVKSFLRLRGNMAVSFSLLTHLILFLGERLTPEKLKNNYSFGRDVFSNFFLNVFFHKKIKWKTLFKYYYWTWDPLWRRYRYRIYWAKKALYKKINWTLFLYFFKRLRAVQPKRKNRVASWHIRRITQHGSLVSKSIFTETFKSLVSQALPFAALWKIGVVVSKFITRGLSFTKPSRPRNSFISIFASMPYYKILNLCVDLPIINQRKNTFFPHRQKKSTVMKSAAWGLKSTLLSKLWGAYTPDEAQQRTSKLSQWKKICSRQLPTGSFGSYSYALISVRKK